MHTEPRLEPARAGVVPARPRIGLLGVMQSLYDEMLPGIADRQAAYAREVAAALSGVAEVEVAPPVKERADAERAMRDLEGARPRRPARRDAHLRARRCASRASSRRRRCRSAWRTSSPSPR